MAIKPPQYTTKAVPGQFVSPGKSDITYQQTHSDLPDEDGMQPVQGTAYELVIAHGKGYGLFATNSIPRGTRVLTESPLMTTPSSTAKHGLPAVDIEGLSKKLDDLSPEQHETYFDLYHDPQAAALASAQLRQVQERFKHASTKLPFPNAHKVEAMVKLHAIYQTNVVRLSDDPKSATGVFPLTSRINHSCLPNLQVHVIPSTEKLIAHAVRHINRGEELTISYSPKVLRTRKHRNDILERWGFECKCRACTGPKVIASEERRSEMLWLDFNLVGFDDPDKYHRQHYTPSTPKQALQKGEKLLELLRAEGITDRGLQDAYRRCSKYSLQAGLFDKAVTYAKKERDVERYCIGDDTAQMPHLEADMKGAEFWLKHVLSERQTHLVKQKAAEKWTEEEMAREATTKTKTKNGGKGRKK